MTTPLYKNEQAGYYEAIFKEHHIVVPIDVFERAITASQASRVAQGEHPQAAQNAAFFDLIDAAYWNAPEWWRPDAPEGTPITHVFNVDTMTFEAPIWQHCQDTLAPSCNCPQGRCCLLQEMKEQQQQKEGREEAAGECWEVHFAEDIDASGDEAALERMGAYFYGLYQGAKAGTQEEARYGSLYCQVMGTLARRELVDEMNVFRMEVNALTHLTHGIVQSVLDIVNKALEREETQNAGTDSTPPLSQS